MSQEPFNTPVPQPKDNPEDLKLRIRELEIRHKIERERYEEKLELLRTENELHIQHERLKDQEAIINLQTRLGQQLRPLEDQIQEQSQRINIDLERILSRRTPTSSNTLIVVLYTIGALVVFYYLISQQITSLSTKLVEIVPSSAQLEPPIAVNSTSEAQLTQAVSRAEAQSTFIIHATDLARVQTTLDAQATQMSASYSPTPITPTPSPTEMLPTSENAVNSQTSTLNPWFIIALLVGLGASGVTYLLVRSQQQQSSSRSSGGNTLAILTILIPAISTVIVTIIGIVPATIPLLQSPTATPTLDIVDLVQTREAEATAELRLATLDAEALLITQTVQSALTATAQLALTETPTVTVTLTPSETLMATATPTPTVSPTESPTPTPSPQTP